MIYLYVGFDGSIHGCWLWRVWLLFGVWVGSVLVSLFLFLEVVMVERGHYFVVFGCVGVDGDVEWYVDTEVDVNSEGPGFTVWNSVSGEWESVEDHMEVDKRMFYELRSLLAKGDE